MSKARKLVTISGSGAIPELNYICAPIINPCMIDVDKIAKIVTGGRKVYEVNPANREETILLTPSIVYNDNFAKKVETPVVTKSEKKAEVKATKTETKKETAKAVTAEVKDEVKTTIAPDAKASDFFKK